jgi:hypothetical protein
MSLPSSARTRLALAAGEIDSLRIGHVHHITDDWIELREGGDARHMRRHCA